jgi:hypothetical protein
LSKRFAAFLAALLAIPCAASDPPPSAQWEIKGIRLGASREQVLAAAPALACQAEPFDPGLESCRDAHAVLADKPALLRVKLLDGRVVLVELARLSRKQAAAAADALAAKYGPANFISEATFRHAFGDHVEKAPKHRWVDGDVQLVVNPLEVDASGMPSGAVYLFDVQQHDAQWLDRYRAKGKGKEAAEAIGL